MTGSLVQFSVQVMSACDGCCSISKVASLLAIRRFVDRSPDAKHTLRPNRLALGVAEVIRLVNLLITN